jgi:hypothetical protein
MSASVYRRLRVAGFDRLNLTIILFFHHSKLNPSVIRAAVLGIICINRLAFAIPMRGKAKRINALTNDVIYYRL